MFVDFLFFEMHDFLLAVFSDDLVVFYGVEERLGMQWCLGEKPVRGGNTEDTTESSGRTEEDDVPCETARFLGIVAGEGADYAADFVVEVE